MPNLSKTTRDHDLIRSWAEQRGAIPSHVKTTGSAEDVGVLRFDFPGYGSEESLEPLGWEEFFEKFDKRGLALVYQDKTAEGQKSNFNKLISAGRGGGTDRSRAGSGTRTQRGHASRSRGSVKKTSSTGRTRTSATKTSTAKRTGAAKKSATRSGRAGTRASTPLHETKSGSRAGGKRSAAQKTASKRSHVSGGRKKASTKKRSSRRG